MQCPRCETRTLKAVDTDSGPTLDFCETCGGVWFDGGELQPFMGWRAMPKRQERKIDLVHCPRCETPTLAGFSFEKGPPLDECSTCGGVWCDQGEVASLKKLSPAARTTRIKEKEIPLLPMSEPTGMKVDWKWVGIGFFLMISMLGMASLGAHVWIASDAVLDESSRTAPVALMLVGGGVSFAFSGFIVGWRSSGYTLLEPAIMAIPAALIFPLLFNSIYVPTTITLLLSSVAAFVVTFIAAYIGENVGQ